jgi:hypothetical protein
MLTMGKRFVGVFFATGFEIIEIDRLKRFVHMQLPWLPIQTQAVPIKDSVGGIAVLLDFENDVSRINRVQSSAWKQDKFIGPGRMPVDQFGDRSFVEGNSEVFPAGTPFQAYVNSGAWLYINEIPELCFWFSAQIRSLMRWRMDLDRKRMRSIQDLDQERKTGLGITFSE